MENDIPKIDLPEDWIIGNLSHKDIGLLNLYANYPCRLKAEIFVLCMQGEIEASINLTRYQVKPGSFITILPGTILQIHKIEGDLQIYFMGIIALMIYNMGSGILRAVGDSKRPLYYLMASCLTNIVLDLALVVGLKISRLNCWKIIFRYLSRRMDSADPS